MTELRNFEIYPNACPGDVADDVGGKVLNELVPLKPVLTFLTALLDDGDFDSVGLLRWTRVSFALAMQLNDITNNIFYDCIVNAQNS